MNARASIMAPMLIIRIFNMHRNHLIIPFSLAFASFSPIRISLFGDFQHLAHANNGKFLAMLMNKLEFYGWGCAKMLTAFFKISLSCRRISFSRFTFLSSSSIVFDALSQEMLLALAPQVLCTIYSEHYQKYQDLWLFVFYSFRWFQRVL